MNSAVIALLCSLGISMGGLIVLRLISAWRNRSTRRENASILMLRESQSKMAEVLKRLEDQVHEQRLILEARTCVDVPTPEDEAKPVKRGKTLADRLKDLGLSHSFPDWTWDYLEIPEEIRGDFAPPIPCSDEESEPATGASCHSCGEEDELVTVYCDSHHLHPGKSFGIFCLDCGRGRLFPEVNNLRKVAGLPELPDRQLMSLILMLEGEAKKRESTSTIPSPM